MLRNYKKLLILIGCMVVFFGNLSAQDSLKLDLTGKEIKFYRKQAMDEFHEKMKRVSTMPYSDNGWYARMHVGYGFPFLTTALKSPIEALGSSIFIQTASGEISEKANITNLGGGVRTGVSIGKHFNPYIGLEFMFNYSRFDAITFSEIRTPGYKSLIRVGPRDFSISPQLTATLPNIRNFYFTLKVGPYFPLGGYADFKADIDDSDGGLLPLIAENTALGPIINLLDDYEVLPPILHALDYNTKVNATGKVKFIEEGNLGASLKNTIGITTALEVRYQFTPAVSIFTEARFTGYHVTLADLTLDQLKGKVKVLGLELDPNELISYGTLNVDYVDELTENSNNPKTNPDGYNPDERTEELGSRESTSAILVNFGIQLDIPKIQRKEDKRIIKRNKKTEGLNF
ncbi:MAG: hypothetical protein K1X55_16915 [Chitinophagales bacterium]|nr:hypothetical protein [Chitinophagales bacterium]